MKKISLIFIIIFTNFILNFTFLNAQVQFSENFDYPVGDSIGAHGWTWNSGIENTIFVSSSGLSYTGYPLSGIGNACGLKNTGNDAYKNIYGDSISSGSVYAAFMVKIETARTGDYFFTLVSPSSTSMYSGRVQVRSISGNGNLNFGITKGNASTDTTVSGIWTTGNYSVGVTYLIVLKYTFVSGSTTDDQVSLFVFSGSIPLAEPAPSIGPITYTSTDATSIGRAVLRQGTNTRAPNLVIDGIQIGRTWESVINPNAQNVNVTPNNVTYPTLGAAFNAINSGTHGNIAVSVTILNNTTEPATAILNGGVFSSCSILPASEVSINGYIEGPVIILNGADNVTIDGRIGGTGSTRSLTINNPNTSWSAGSIQLQNGASLNTIKYINCNGIGVANTQGGRAIYVRQSSAGTGGNNNNTIDHCMINGAWNGVEIYGSASLYTNDNTVITNNIVKNCSQIGIFIGNETINTTVDGNEIYNDQAVAGDATPVAIRSDGVGTINIRKNKIHDYAFTSLVASGYPFTASILTQPVLLTAPGSNVTTVNINNNFVSNIADNAAAKGIYGINPWSSNAAYTANVYNNTVLIGGNAGSTSGTISHAILADLSVSGSTLNSFNNIGYNTRNGGDEASLHIGYCVSPGPGVTIHADYNIGRATDPVHGYNLGFNGSHYRGTYYYHDSTYNYSGGPIEQNTVAQDVSFVSLSDLHLAPGTVGGNFAGTPTGAPLTDIDGENRSTTYPYRGADEKSAFKLFNLTCKLEGRSTTEVYPAEMDVQLSNAVSPYNKVALGFTHLENTNIAVIPFGDAVGSGPYWITCYSSSHIETWSISAISFTGNPSYNFLTSGAYGGNTTPAGEFFGGDVNQNGIIDLTDVLLVYNDASIFTSGKKVTDVTGDHNVDLTDVIIAYNNSSNFVGVIRP